MFKFKSFLNTFPFIPFACIMNASAATFLAGWAIIFGTEGVTEWGAIWILVFSIIAVAFGLSNPTGLVNMISDFAPLFTEQEREEKSTA